ncbi:YhbP family protein [Tatumella terrea]|uniref:YhbP family protein n=1 Tax=Tatumella terrea TaxID=419007 RepID=UPI0031D6E90F
MSDLNHCLNYLKKHHVLTLCTGSGDTLWAANCFYVLDETGIAFWLMTEETTRHGELMRLNARVAGTVTTPASTVMKIQGIQYAGEIFQPEGEREKQALACYQQHFPIARAMKAPLWEIRLDELKMTDNTLGFGKKIHWSRTS